MRIAITGTPGTGKTSVSKILSEELGFDYVDLNKLAQERGLVLGKDVKRNSLIIDTKKLGDLILPRNCVIDGHLSHYCAADLVFVLRCDPLELKKRMLVKKWSLSKMRENMEAEALGILAQEARRFHKEVYELDTTGKST